MEVNTLLSLTLIAGGAGIMSANIMKFRHLKRLAWSLFGENRVVDKRQAALYHVHYCLMTFFLIGYCVVFGAIAGRLAIISNVFVGLIFFFGAVFVSVGLLLQRRMLENIKTQQQRLLQKNEQLVLTQQVTVNALAYLAEVRDCETGRHLERTAHYVRILAQELAKFPAYKEYLTPGYIADIVCAAPLHDIGKVSIADSILNKPGKLTPEEFELIKQHCACGARILKKASEKLHFESFLQLAVPLVLSHHEKWNGRGYPQGLVAAEIPLAARLMAVSDVYDALRNKRCYKPALSHEQSYVIIVEERGQHFDPEIVDCFIKMQGEFLRVSEQLAG